MFFESFFTFKSKLFKRIGKLTWFFTSLLVLTWQPAWGQGKSFKDDMAERTRACTACHGDQGKAGPDGYYPRLAGKPAGYLFNQLKNFQEGKRHYT